MDEGLFCGYVLRKLQSSDLCDALEWGGVCEDNDHSDDYPVPDHTDRSLGEAESFPAALYAEGLKPQKEEKGFPAEHENKDHDEVPSQDYFPESPELYYHCDRNILCKCNSAVWQYVRTAAG